MIKTQVAKFTPPSITPTQSRTKKGAAIASINRIIVNNRTTRRATAIMMPQNRTWRYCATGARWLSILMYKRLSNPSTACKKHSITRLPKFSMDSNSAMVHVPFLVLTAGIG